MKLNKKISAELVETAGGGKAKQVSFEAQLRRSVMSCMLWENEHYEDGETIATRIAALIPKVDEAIVSQIAIAARSDMHLRHIPLFIVREMARHKSHKRLVAETLAKVIQRPDELTEFLKIYWTDGRCPISAQVKKGLALAFTKFSEFQLAKYNQDSEIKLRDVLFLCHAKPLVKTQEKVWKKLVDGTLETPDTWEVALSSGADKKKAWSRLLKEEKLGALALLRNLRNMKEAGVDTSLVKDALLNANTDRVLPFRFITAAKYAPDLEPTLEEVMLKNLAGQDKLPGRTVLVVDVSGSMGAALSSKSELTRLKTASALAILAREMCDDVAVYATGGNDYSQIHATKQVPARRGFALAETIEKDNLGGGGIFLAQCMDYIAKSEENVDRVIVITDEVDCDKLRRADQAKKLGQNNYIINVANAKNGVGYGGWTKIDGFSESVLDYIKMVESYDNNRR